MTPTLLLLLLLAQGPGAEVPPQAAHATSPAQRWHSLLRAEATTLLLLPRGDMGPREGFVQLEPTWVVDGGEEWGLNVGAPVRLRLWGGEDGASLVRHEGTRPQAGQ